MALGKAGNWPQNVRPVLERVSHAFVQHGASMSQGYLCAAVGLQMATGGEPTLQLGAGVQDTL